MMDGLNSEELCLISQVIYLQYGEYDPEDKAKIVRLSKHISNLKRDVVVKEPQNIGAEEHTKNTMASALWGVL